jgi:uncharacterized protein (DUF362 family)
VSCRQSIILLSPPGAPHSQMCTAVPEMLSRRVSIWQGSAVYPSGPLIHPSGQYPACPFGAGDDEDPVYQAVRESLKSLGLDEERYGTTSWNPLGVLIKPGDRVLIKPNLIREGHGSRPKEWEQVITHPSVIWAVLDYVHIALQGKGQVIVADGPQMDSDFAEICRRTSLLQLTSFFRAKGLDVSILDLRRERWFQRGGVTYRRGVLPGDPLGYTTVDLGEASAFQEYHLNGRFYGADYDAHETAQYHSGGHHAYVLCRTAIDADVIINLPKMKTHKKTGITLGLKNMVGVNGHRNCLPHHTLGTPADGGDEFPESSHMRGIQSSAIAAFKRCLTMAGGRGGRLSRLAVRLGRAAFGDTSEVIRSGNWHGNDTIWRTVLDLNKILLHFDGNGNQRRNLRRYLTLVDGVVAGEGDGPSAPDRKEVGVIVAGLNPVAVDTVCATIMGFDYRKIPLLKNAWYIDRYPLVGFRPEDVVCESNVPEWRGSLWDLLHARHLGFFPHVGWIGHIERDGDGGAQPCADSCDYGKGIRRS